MPEVNQYVVKPKEIAELIVKSANIHEGEWWLVASFGFAPGNFGPTDTEMAPGVAVVVQNLTIQRVLPTTIPRPPEALVVDAAQFNPKPKT